MKVVERKLIESDLFYIEICGYKLKLRIYFNGFRFGKNNYLLVFFVIMKGEYDVILNWFFKRKVKFILID